ncbi:hypothetical protein DKX38_024555 [Salix brachista]|uniref:Retrovirus-related Pol polyprotein from transposon TNT 1-94-like beta-barrel domain-containing protein n=1 Tax=Salix brachista TaxID=2182728 RepID=A0A5N5JNI4_9ROSI|nr:hypothetical protein DKX38_024555 [Salix brachista]
MIGTKNTGEGSSMAMISKTPFKLCNLRAIEEVEKDKLRCSQCNGNRHTKDTCFEIHGYPDWFLEKRKQSKTRSNKRLVQTKLTENPSSFVAMATSQRNHTETSELRPLDQTTDPSSATDNTGVVLSTSTVHDTSWIIDSGATDHVTYNESLFQNMTSPFKEKVMTANGDFERHVKITCACQDRRFTDPSARSPEGNFHGTDESEAMSCEPKVTLTLGVWATQKVSEQETARG